MNIIATQQLLGQAVNDWKADDDERWRRGPESDSRQPLGAQATGDLSFLHLKHCCPKILTNNVEYG